jgi:hypothetical protein
MSEVGGVFFFVFAHITTGTIHLCVDTICVLDAIFLPQFEHVRASTARNTVQTKKKNRRKNEFDGCESRDFSFFF